MIVIRNVTAKKYSKKLLLFVCHYSSGFIPIIDITLVVSLLHVFLNVSRYLYLKKLIAYLIPIIMQASFLISMLKKYFLVLTHTILILLNIYIYIYNISFL